MDITKLYIPAVIQLTGSNNAGNTGIPEKLYQLRHVDFGQFSGEPAVYSRSARDFLKIFKGPANHRAFVLRKGNEKICQQAKEMKEIFDYFGQKDRLNDFMEFSFLLYGVKPAYYLYGEYGGTGSPLFGLLKKYEKTLKNYGFKIHTIKNTPDDEHYIVYNTNAVKKIINTNGSFYRQFGSSEEEILTNTFKKNLQGQFLGYGRAYTDNPKTIPDDKIAIFTVTFDGIKQKNIFDLSFLCCRALKEDIPYLKEQYQRAAENMFGIKTRLQTHNAEEDEKFKSMPSSSIKDYIES